MIGKVRFAASLATLAQSFAPHRGGSSCAMLVHRFATLAFAATLLALSGCSGGCSPEKKENVPPPVIDRSKDPEYAKVLRERMDAQRETASRGHKILRELEAARAEDPESEKTKELEKQYTEVAAELEKQRIVNMAIIRERMLKEQADRAKAAADAKEKK
ncbi:MAG: hypothetical protein IJG18_06885 [Kiritimatiellae bacterium]|nr:hypothetical protein [Kiritimatiellia bacterium]